MTTDDKIKFWTVRIVMILIAFFTFRNAPYIGYIYTAYAFLSLAMVPVFIYITNKLHKVVQGEIPITESPYDISEDNDGDAREQFREWFEDKGGLSWQYVLTGFIPMLAADVTMFMAGWTVTGVISIVSRFGMMFANYYAGIRDV